MAVADKSSILLIGASGYLGSLVASGLLCEGYRIVAPIRGKHTRESLIDKIKADLAIENLDKEVDFDRLITMALPPINEIQSLSQTISKLEVNEIIHCAGSVDYFDSIKLKEVNIDLTNELIALGKQQQIKRFVYLSTAFSSGFVHGLVPEALHTTPEIDPTEYTQSKREAENLVSNSELPFLIIRPSIVIGDSRNGRYSGKPYGLYQFWSAFEKFLCDQSRTVLHFIAPTTKLHVIHQDAFKAGFLSACSQLPDNSIVHLTSRDENLPTVREMIQLWCEMLTHVRQVHYYKNVKDIPSSNIDRRTRMWLEFTAVNNDIAAHPWQFQTAALDHLRATGLKFKDCTLDTVRVCQDHFVAQSQRVQSFLKNSKVEINIETTSPANVHVNVAHGSTKVTSGIS